MRDHYREHTNKPEDDLRHAEKAADLIHGAMTKARIKARQAENGRLRADMDSGGGKMR